jgi:hypothetical protein
MPYEPAKPWKKCRLCGVTQPIDSTLGGLNVLKVNNGPEEFECKDRDRCRKMGADGKAFDTGQTPMVTPPFTPETNPSRVQPAVVSGNGAANGATEKS